MKEEDFPEKVTDKNIEDLIEKAEKLKKKGLQPRYGLAIAVPYSGFALLFVFGSLYLMLWLALNNYLDFLLWFSPEWQGAAFFALLFAVYAVVILPILVFSLLSIIWILRKYFGYPKHEEAIFAECFVIAKHLMNNERLKAKEKVYYFLACLTAFVRDLGYNSKRKIYAPEFDLLRCGKNEISRMLMFSDDKTPKLLMDFGLAFVRNDDPEAFSNLKQLIERVREYGELKGRFRRFLGGIEQYPHSLPFVISMIVIAVAILYFVVSGQRLPIG